MVPSVGGVQVGAFSRADRFVSMACQSRTNPHHSGATRTSNSARGGHHGDVPDRRGTALTGSLYSTPDRGHKDWSLRNRFGQEYGLFIPYFWPRSKSEGQSNQGQSNQGQSNQGQSNQGQPSQKDSQTGHKIDAYEGE